MKSKIWLALVQREKTADCERRANNNQTRQHCCQNCRHLHVCLPIYPVFSPNDRPHPIRVLECCVSEHVFNTQGLRIVFNFRQVQRDGRFCFVQDDVEQLFFETCIGDADLLSQINADLLGVNGVLRFCRSGETVAAMIEAVAAVLIMFIIVLSPFSKHRRCVRALI